MLIINILKIKHLDIKTYNNKLIKNFFLNKKNIKSK